MRANVTRVWLAIGALGLISGCNCGITAECEDLFVTFDSPKDGATGVPATTDVKVKIATGAGAAIELDSATLVNRSTSATEFSVPRDGTITSGAVTFSGVTLEPGPNLIKVTVRKKGTSCTGTKSVTVEVPVSSEPPKVLTFAYPQDTALPTGTLNSVELPATTPLRIDLTTQFALGGTVEIIDTATGASLGSTPAPLTNSAVTVTVPPTSLSADKTYSLFAKITNGTKVNTAALNPVAVKLITLDRTAPTCSVTAPVKTTLGPNDDADSTAANYQLRAAATTNAKATTVELKLSGGTTGTSGPTAPTNLVVSKDFTIADAGTLAYTITAEAKDAVGNICTATKMVTVDFEGPTLTIISPDGGVETSFNVPVFATVVGGNGGFVEWKISDSMGANRALKTDPVDAGVSSFIGNFLSGVQTISATPTDAVGNAGATVTRQFTVTPSTGCSVMFTRPSTRPGFITAGQVSAGNYTFQASSTCVTGTMITLKRDGAVISTQAVAGGAVNWTVPVTTGTFKFRADVGTVFDEIDVVIDLNTPTITQPFDGTTLNIASDTVPGTPGVQRQLSYVATVPVGGRVDICSNQVPAGTGGACADGAAGWWTLKSSATTPDPSFNFPDGAYCLKAVIVSGTTTNVSMPVCLTVDGTAPTLSGITLLRDANTDGKLNIAELNNLPPEFQFTLGAGHVQSQISTVQVRAGTTIFNTMAAGNVTYSGAMLNIVNVKLDQNVTPTSQSYSFIIEVTDKAGNMTPSPAQAVKIDKVAPTCTITSPSASTLLGAANDVNMATPGFDLKVDVSSSSDAQTVTIATSGGQTLSAMVTASSGTASNTFALTQTSGAVSYNLSATCTDDSGNATAATGVTGVSVDLDPPTCTMTAPAASPPQYSTLSIPTSVTVGGPGTVGQTVTIFSQIGAGTPAQVGSFVVAANGIASGTVSYNTGLQTVTAKVSDPAGNVCTTAARTIDVNSSQCAIAFTSPTIGAGGKAFLTSTTFSVTGASSNCGAGKQVQLFLVGNVTPLATGTTTGGATSSTVSITNAMLAQGGPYTLRLTIDNGAGLTTDSDLSPVYVDSTPPTSTSVEFNMVAYPAAGTSLAFVAAGNKNLPNATYVTDSVAGGNADFNVKVNAVTGALGGKVRVLYQGVQKATADVTTSPQDISINAIALVQNTTGPFQIEITDEAGNASRPVDVSTAVVDVQPPAAPVVSPSLESVRGASVKLTWMPSLDDATDALSGPEDAGYEVRWSTSTVLNNNQLMTVADYNDSARAYRDTNEPPSATVINRVLTLPPNNTYYLAVRALDEVGNYSNYTTPATLANPATTDILTNPAGSSTSYGAVAVANGSVNGDSLDDLVVSASTAANVHVYFGSSSFGTQPGCAPPACQTIAIPVARNPGTEGFGNSVAIGKVVGASSDILVGSSSFNSSLGRAFLFFGGANPDAGTLIDDTQYVELRGTVAAAGFGGHVSVLPDVNGDGIAEMGVTAQATNSQRGRYYIFKGRTKSAWISAAAGTFIADTAADWVIEGPAPLFGIANNFGARLSVSSLGPLTSGPGNDFAISAAHENVNEVYLISSAKLLDAGTITTGHADAGTANLAFQTLWRPQIGTATFTAFGGVVLGNLDVTGATAKDLIVANRKEGSFFVYQDGTPTSFGSPMITVTGSNNFGTNLVPGDFNGDGKPDLVCTESAPVSSPNNVWVLYNHTNSYDPAVGQFFQSVFTGTVAVSGAYGASVAVGNFDNDGGADIAFSDRSTGFGRVLVWH